MIIKVNIKVKEEDQCMVANYRCRPPQWESGICRSVEVHIRSNGEYRVSYYVLLDRRTIKRSRMHPDGGAPIFITVGNNDIEPIK